MPPHSRPAQTSTLSPIPARRVDWTGWIGGAILAAGAIAAYCRTFQVALLFDDGDAITNNPSIRHWSTALWAPILTTAGGRPVLNLSLAVNYAISGTEVGSYHAANLAIHILAGLTLFGILRRAFATREGTAADPIAFSASLLWLLHPLQTESVTYIVQRAESLMGLFYLLTLYCFIRGAEAEGRPRRPWFALCVAACLLGMATKEVMASAPLIVLLYDRAFVAGSFREAWKDRWRVHCGLAATWLLLAFLILATHGRGGSVGFGSGVSWWSYAQTQFPAIARYLRLSVWPHGLVFDYGTQWVADFRNVLPEAVVVAGLAGASVWALFRPGILWRFLGFSGFWFFAILAPTSLVPGNRQTAAEHRMYLALIPVIVPVVIGIYRWLGRAALPVCMVLAAGLFGATWERNEMYRNALNLWADTVANCPESAFAHNSLACELDKDAGRLPEAVAELETALRLKPDYEEAYNNLGFALNAEGRAGEAIAPLQVALRFRPDYADAHNNMGNALVNLPGRLPEAIAEYDEALRLKPDFVEAHNNLANALIRQGRTREAIVHYEKALWLRPDFVEAHCNLANTLNEEGRTPEAIAHYEEALRLRPDSAAIHYYLAVSLLRYPARTGEAVAHLQETLRLQPDNDGARELLAKIEASQP